MTILQACVLGFFQGIAEFLPISSSGHLLVFKNIFGLQDVPILFDVILHIATLASILVVFRKRIANIIISVFNFILRKNKEEDKENLGLVIPALVATAITGVIGYFIDGLELVSPKIASIGFIITGLLLIISSRFNNGTTTYKDMKIKHGIITGIAQGIGVLPGISRSGITITGSLVSGLKRNEAGEFAFLLAIPAILGALLIKLKDLSALQNSVSLSTISIASVISFVTGIVALRLLMPLVKKGRLIWFSVYLIPAGILGLILL